jgi:hypothetical protein
MNLRLHAVLKLLSSVSAAVCNNNFIGGRNPGERSSQYAAEASCRERFGSSTDWMSFMDIDEYLVPMQKLTWGPLLEDKKKTNSILALRSTRALPRIEYMEEVTDPEICSNPSDHNDLESVSCLVAKENVTFLRLYNCDNVRRPRPPRFSTNMKQIYRPAIVLSHFVHYSVVTRQIATYFRDFKDPTQFSRQPSRTEKYVNTILMF